MWIWIETVPCISYQYRQVHIALSYFKWIKINWEWQQQQISYLSSLDAGCDWLRPLSGFVRNCQFLQSPVPGCCWDCPCLSLRRQRIRSQESPSPSSAHYQTHVTRGIMGITHTALAWWCTLLSKSIRVSSESKWSHRKYYEQWTITKYIVFNDFSY